MGIKDLDAKIKQLREDGDIGAKDYHRNKLLMAAGLGAAGMLLGSRIRKSVPMFKDTSLGILGLGVGADLGLGISRDGFRKTKVPEYSNIKKLLSDKHDIETSEEYKNYNLARTLGGVIPVTGGTAGLMYAATKPGFHNRIKDKKSAMLAAAIAAAGIAGAAYGGVKASESIYKRRNPKIEKLL
jgi:hypothetical protein